MPVVNGNQLTRESEINARFNSFSLTNQSQYYSSAEIQKCEAGSVLVDDSLDPALWLNQSDATRIREIVYSIPTGDYPNHSLLKTRCIAKNNYVKKFHLDSLNTAILKKEDQRVFDKLISISNYMSKKLSQIAGDNEIHSYQTILYPSTTLGRELHLDRHDRTRKHQNCRSIKAFMNLSPNSFRIWGIGSPRSSLLAHLNLLCEKQGLPKINYKTIDSKKQSYPSWFDFQWSKTNLNHPVSIINEYLNSNLLSRADLKGQFDIVYYDPFSMLIVDSKQVSHKPMYGELGVSVDMVYNKKDALIA